MKTGGLQTHIAKAESCSSFDPWGAPSGFGGCACAF